MYNMEKNNLIFYLNLLARGFTQNVK